MITDPIFRAKQVKALKAYYKNSTERFQEWMDDIEVNQESLYPTLSFAETGSVKLKRAQAIPARMTVQVGQMVAVSIMVALVLGLLHLRVKNEFQGTQDDKPHVDLTKPDIEK